MQLVETVFLVLVDRIERYSTGRKQIGSVGFAPEMTLAPACRKLMLLLGKHFFVNV